MKPDQLNAWLGVAAVAIPEVATFIKSLFALRQKYPQLTDAQIQGVVVTITGQADAAFDDVLAKIAADQAAHPPTP